MSPVTFQEYLTKAVFNQNFAKESRVWNEWQAEKEIFKNILKKINFF